MGQTLLLDADLIPLAMQMYPGNRSEKPYMRMVIEEMKQRYKVSGRTVQVADKGLNCARNIYSAVKEADDGYIFSKSIKGTSLSRKEKEWILLENDENIFTDYTDDSGKIMLRLKTCVDTISYSFKEVDPETENEKVTSFSVREKRVVSYNPALATKQKAEIMKMVDKASDFTTYKQISKEELDESAKYIKVTNKDSTGKTVKPFISINIEESFRVTKSYLDARPVYAQKKESIYGHFLICYISLFLLRVLELKYFKGTINAYDLISFIRDFILVDKGDATYINISKNQAVNEKIKAVTGLTTLDALFLTEKEVNNLFRNCILIDN